MPFDATDIWVFTAPVSSMLLVQLPVHDRQQRIAAYLTKSTFIESPAYDRMCHMQLVLYEQIKQLYRYL